ncbi:MAG: tetratricopeptide repeat protein, partial [Chloroflexi bacterium]|nr:tetratricopeptide repeat protein [Chloroflexota bacterium]
LAMGLPFLLAAALRSGRASLRALAALGAAAVLVAIFLTLSRASWLGAAIGVLTTATLLAVCTDDGRALLRRLWPPPRRWLIGALALATLAVAAAGVTYVVSSVEARPLWLFPASGEARSDGLQAGAEMLGDHALLGTGPGAYRLLYPQYSGSYPVEAADTGNGFLQAAVEMGVPGLLAMAGLVVALVWLLIRGLLEAADDTRRSLVACTGSLAAFATFSLFDAPNGAQGPLMMLAAVGAVAVLSHREGVAPSDSQASRFRPSDAALAAVRVAVPVMLAGLLITWGRLDIGHYYYSNGLAAADAGRWSQAVGRAQRAVELDPQFALYRLQLGVVQGQAYLETGDQARLDDALAQLGRGVEMEPRSAIGHANLALLLADALAREQTRTEALAALRFANGDPAIALAAGTALEVSNWGEEAVDAYAQAISMDPNLADSPFWSGSPFRRTEFAEIVRRSSLDTCAVLALAEVASAAFGSREEALNACRLLVEADPDDAAARVALAAALIDEGELDEAFVHLDEALARRPDYGPARTTLGRWYEAQGEVEEARRQWLRAGQLRQPEALAFLGDSFAPDTVPPEIVRALRSQLADGEPYHSLGSLYYRRSFYRASPNVLLLPGEWQQATPRALLRARDALARWTDEGIAP